MIHNVLPIRTTLYRDGLIEDATCNLCNATEQTLTHLLTNCVTIAEFWTLFQNWWREKKKRNHKVIYKPHTLRLVRRDKTLAGITLLLINRKI